MVRTMASKTKRPPKNYVAYFELCQAIGGVLEEQGRGIAKMGIHAPIFHKQIIEDLEGAKAWCECAIKAVNEAQESWKR